MHTGNIHTCTHAHKHSNALKRTEGVLQGSLQVHGGPCVHVWGGVRLCRLHVWPEVVLRPARVVSTSAVLHSLGAVRVVQLTALGWGVSWCVHACRRMHLGRAAGGEAGLVSSSGSSAASASASAGCGARRPSKGSSSSSLSPKSSASRFLSAISREGQLQTGECCTDQSGASLATDSAVSSSIRGGRFGAVRITQLCAQSDSPSSPLADRAGTALVNTQLCAAHGLHIFS